MTRRRSALVATAAAAAIVVVAGPAYAFWSVGSSGATGTTKAGQLGTPTAAAAASGGSIVITVTAAPASGPTPTSYRVARTSPTSVSSACVITGSTGSCTDATPGAGTNAYAVYAKVGTNWESATPATASASTDATPPTNALSLTAPTGAFLAGSGSPYTLYYKGNAAGSFKLVDTVADSGSGPASAAFPAVTATGWTHAAQTVTTPAGGPYASSTFNWTASPANPATYTVTGADNAGNTSTATMSFASDTTGPAGGSISYANGYVTTASVAITLANGTDGGSGVNAPSAQVQRAATTLSNGVCGTFGSFANVTLTGGADTGVTSGNCYEYRYLVSDNVGNQTTYTSANVAKVDTVAPSVTAISMSNGNGSVGQADAKDTLTITYSEAMDTATFCSGWTGAGDQILSGNGQVTVTITDNGSNDVLTVASTGCTGGFTLGSVALGADYVSATTQFAGSNNSKSMLAWTASTNRLTVTLGSPTTATTRSSVASSVPTYAPASGLTDLAGNALPTAAVNGTSSRF